MLILNFGHPLTDKQIAQITDLLGVQPVVRNITVKVDRGLPVEQAVQDIIEASGLTRNEWQTLPILINPPGLATLALALLVEVHGRSGHFPAMLNLRPVPNVRPTCYEVAEIVNLQALRDVARGHR